MVLSRISIWLLRCCLILFTFGHCTVHADIVDRLQLRSRSLASRTADVCPRPASGSIVQDAPVLRSVDGVLEVEMEYLTSVDELTKSNKFCYVTDNSTALLAPTLYVHPGDEIVLTISNRLPNSLGIPDYGFEGDLPLNFSICPLTDRDVTPSSINVHWHGIGRVRCRSVTPLCGGDQVLKVAIDPGQTYTYTLPIREDLSPGNYWYHPHVTGDSETNILGGASGAIIVHGLENLQPAIQLVPPKEVNDSNVPGWDISINYVPVTYAERYKPAIIEMQPEEVQVWDVTNAAADTIFDLQLLYDGEPQVLEVVSRDAAPVRAKSGNVTVAATSNETHILLGCAARAQFIVRGPSAAVKNATLITRNIDTGPLGDNDPLREIANIIIDPSAAAPELLFAMNGSASSSSVVLPVSPDPLQSDRNRTLYFSEVVQNPNNPNSPTTFYLTQEGDNPIAFYATEPARLTIQQGHVEHWVVQNRAQEVHVFHTHQLHFTILDANSISDPYHLGQSLDTIVIPYWNKTGPYPSYKIQLDFRSVDVGLWIAHCHIAGHEDQGMTMPIRVVPAATSSS